MHTIYLRAARLGLLTLAMALFLIAAGCTGDSSDNDTDGGTETGNETPAGAEDTPAADGTVEVPGTTGGSAIDGVTAYVTETGLGGKTFQVAEPINCNAFLDPAADPELVETASGKVCINFAESKFSATDGVIGVLVVGSEATWKLKMELKDLAWVVTSAEPSGE